MTDPIGSAALRAVHQALLRGDQSLAARPSAPAGPSFGDTLKQALGQFSDVQESANDQIGAFLRGEDVELHQVMAAAEEAGIALELLVEIRNKLTEAYRTVINMHM